MRLLPLVLFFAAAACAQESPYAQSYAPQPVHGPVLTIRVLADGSALADTVAADSASVVSVIRDHVRAHPDGGVYFSSDRGAPYARYIHFLDAVKAAYVAEWDAVALRSFGRAFMELDEQAKAAVREKIPMRVTLAEPE